MNPQVESYTLSKGWQTKEHTSPSGLQIQVKHCPLCRGGNHGDTWTFALNAETGAGICKRGNCGWKGSFLELQRELGDQPLRTDFRPSFFTPPKREAKVYTRPKDEVTARHEALLASQPHMAYLTTTKKAKKTNRKGKEVDVQGRGFTTETIKRFRLGLFTGKIAGHEDTWISIPYLRDGQLVRQKYRTIAKDFGLDAGSEPYLFNRDAVTGKTALLCEGEFDALAWVQCGIEYAVSIPDGCADLNWIDHNWDWLDELETILIAFDGDEGGQKLEREVVTRLGRDRCVKVVFPEGIKDANGCIQAGMSAAEVKALVDNAVPYPMEALKQAVDLYDDVFALYHNLKPMGESTGWPTLDRIWGGIRTGEVTVVTGTPSSGKSEWVNALLVNLARIGIRSAVGSFENPPAKVIRNQVSQYLGLPFYGPLRMTEEQLQDGMLWLDERVLYLDLPDDEQSWESVEEHFRYAARRYGCKVLVADPVMMLLGESSKDSERFDIDRIMRRARAIATDLDVHVILVMHPKKLSSDDAVAQLYDINGSAGVRNLTFNGVSIWRNRKTEVDGINEVIAYLLKNREFGIEGAVSLLFDPLTKRYRENPNPSSGEATKPKPQRSPQGASARAIVRSLTEPDDAPPPLLAAETSSDFQPIYQEIDPDED